MYQDDDVFSFVEYTRVTEEEVKHINYVPDSVHLVTLDRCNDHIDCKGCDESFKCATEFRQQHGIQVKKVYPHYEWFKHCYNCMRFAELGLVKYCNSCWSRFLNNDLKNHHSPKCCVIAERNKNLYNIKSPELCLNVSPYFDKATIVRPFWPETDKEGYERRFMKSYDDGSDLTSDIKAKQVHVHDSNELNKSSNCPSPESSSMEIKRRKISPEISNAVALVPKRRHSSLRNPPDASTPRSRPSLLVGVQPRYVYKVPPSQEDDFCARCNVCSKHVIDLVDHQKKAHSTQYREETLRKEKDFRREFMDHPKRRCPRCKIKFHKISDVESHIRAVHECVVCPKCSQLFESDHSSSLAGNSFLKHEHCTLKYVGYEKYSRASEIVTTFKWYFDELTDKCSVCDDEVKGENMKKKHFIRHVGARYKCTSCFQSFCDAQGLKSHSRRKHENEIVDTSEDLDLYWLLIDE